MTVGLFGGTFDPIHRGHIDVARAARRALDLDQVWLIPSKQPPHRAQPRASAAHRFAMAALAVANEDGLYVSDVEMDVVGPTYTIDTAERVSSLYPALHTPLTFITGADAFLDIKTWRSYGTLLDMCHFVVVARPGYPTAAIREALPDLAPRMVDAPHARVTTPHIFLVDAATADVSSTDVRHALAIGRPSVDLIAEPVTTYAIKHGLYLNDNAREQRFE